MLLNQVFWPDRAATAQMGMDLARELTEAGYEVVAVAQRNGYEVGGKDYPKHEVIDGVEIRRAGRCLFGRGSFVLRAIDQAQLWLVLGWRAFFTKRVDVVITFTTPPLIGLVGWLMRVCKGTRVVYWSMDLYPDIPVAYGLMSARNPIAWVWERCNRFSLRRADRVAVLGRCMGEVIKRKGVREEALFDGGVWADPDELLPVARQDNPFVERWNVEDRFVVMYAGNYGMGHEMQTMLDAAEAMRERDDVLFIFAGGGTRKAIVEAFVAEKQLANCQCHPYQDRAELAALLSLGDVHLISQLEPLLGMFVPSKTYGVMSVARPAIAIGPPESEAAQTLLENDCGFAVRQGDVDGLMDTIELLTSSRERSMTMGNNGRAALLNRYTKTKRCALWSAMLGEFCTEKA